MTGRVKVAGVEIQVEAGDPEELLRQLALFSDCPQECPVCGAEVRFTHRRPQQFEYFGLRCTGSEPHETTFGKYRDGGLYYKGDWIRLGSGGQDPSSGGGSREPEPRRPAARQESAPAPRPTPRQAAPPAEAASDCARCRADLRPAVRTYSERTFGRPLCTDCQALTPKPRRPRVPAGAAAPDAAYH